MPNSYIKTGDPSNFLEVIEIANRAGKQDDLVRYLQMARKTLREPKLDTELAYAYAKMDRLHDMEDFLGMTNVADIFLESRLPLSLSPRPLIRMMCRRLSRCSWLPIFPSN